MKGLERRNAAMRDKVGLLLLICLLSGVCHGFRGASVLFVEEIRAGKVSCYSLYDQSKKIVVTESIVNDDYCDCAGGEDEPGTSACSNGKFFCSMNMVEPRMINSSWVNDGFCDCCDGADEYDGRVQCLNRCDEDRLSVLASRLAQKEVIRKGLEHRDNLEKIGKQVAEESKTKVQESEEELENLEREIADVESAVSTAHEHKKKLEEAKPEVDEADVDNEEAKPTSPSSKVPYRDHDPDDYYDDYDDYGYMVDEKSKKPAKDDIQGDRTAKEEEEEDDEDDEEDYEEDYEDYDEEFDEDYDEDYDGDYDEDYDGDYYEEEEGQNKEETGSAEEATEQEEPEPTLDLDMVCASSFAKEPSTSSFLESAKAKIAEVPLLGKLLPGKEAANIPNQSEVVHTCISHLEGKKKDLLEQKIRVERNLKDHKKQRRGDGAPFAYRGLSKECMKTTIHQYVYELCVFDQVKQYEDGKFLGSLGSWTSGLAHTQHYKNGATCWQGPKRSTTVTFHCGATNKIEDVQEPGRCVYKMTVSSPAACTHEMAEDMQKQVDEINLKEEL